MSGRGRRVPPTARLAEFPETAAERACWWEWHILEVLHGLAPDAVEGAVPRPQFDPKRHSLAERERAKAAELTAAGHQVTASGIKQRRQRYQRDGLIGLADGRSAKQMPAFGKVDPAVVEAMRQAIGETGEDSSKTIGFVVWRAKEILADRADAAAIEAPSRATLYRLYSKLAIGTHATGSARARRSVNARPSAPFGEVPASAPGELMQIDSTPLDVLVRLDDGIAEKVELTAMVDVATRSITAAVLRPTTKAADASALLARSVTPEAMRPGWSQALRMSRSVLPHRRLLSLDERLEHAAARPVIVPETIVCDHGKVFISNNFRASCRYLGINLQPAHKATPTDKGTIEKTLGSVATLFAQFVAGYTGSNPDRRGRKLEDRPLWSLPELQNLLDEWIIAVWQTRPHDGLRDPDAPKRAFSPNEKYATLLQSCGYVPVPLNGEDYIELLPERWQAINSYGIRIKHRTYDDGELGPMRRQHSGAVEKKGLWEIHHDPYDISRIWVRDRQHDRWITVFWKHLRRVGVPFGELAWDHACEQVPGGTEEQIADAAAALLRRAHDGPAPKKGPAAKRSRRVAARTWATAPERPVPEPPAAEAAQEDPADSELAEVIPLGLFDPLANPWRRP
ncbi:Mu transposase C-terminal domain-containing protein [Streptomyces sp. NBC_00690]|uniref:Mu transposase C-terminal domain-containing protein n=1 Tax=Streptomyces sp. NBC_00690 TaxID=2975808 RepID=UPI002E290401|nr:Mu transposase C-terminal domain-containing protein [Streptomyces sp. NBC_00690]